MGNIPDGIRGRTGTGVTSFRVQEPTTGTDGKIGALNE